MVASTGGDVADEPFAPAVAELGEATVVTGAAGGTAAFYNVHREHSARTRQYSSYKKSNESKHGAKCHKTIK